MKIETQGHIDSEIQYIDKLYNIMYKLDKLIQFINDNEIYETEQLYKHLEITNPRHLTEIMNACLCKLVWQEKRITRDGKKVWVYSNSKIVGLFEEEENTIDTNIDDKGSSIQ